MKNLLLSVFLIVLLLSGCSNGTPSRQNTFTPLTSIVITAVSSTIAAQTSTRLTATGNYSGLFTRDITAQVVWSSDTPTVAGFVIAAAPSRVKGLAPGTANLTATLGNVSATPFPLTVSAATIQTMTISPVNPTIPKGINQQFTASGDFLDGTTLTTQDMTFDATWASSDPNVATISNVAGSNGFAQTLAAGTTDITATFNSVSSAPSLLTVTVPVLQTITVTPATPSVLSLSTASFTATGHYSDGTTPDITNQVAWTSSNTAIATINATTGVATTLAPGSITIGATLGSVTGTATLKVTGGNLQSITVSTATLSGIANAPANLTMAPNTSVRITTTGSFSNGASRDISGVVTWATGNTNLATVTLPTGNLVFLRAPATATAGSTTVTATYGTVVSPATTLTITTAALSNVTVSPITQNLALPVGASTRFTATANFNDGTIEDVTASIGCTWAATPASPVTVGTGGLVGGQVTGVAIGTTTITPTFGGLTPVALPTVAVTAPTLQSLNLSISGTLAAGNQVRYTAKANYSDGTLIDVTENTTWSIDNQNIAILADSASQPGQVVGVSSGSATLTAKFLSQTQTATVTVP